MWLVFSVRFENYNINVVMFKYERIALKCHNLSAHIQCQVHNVKALQRVKDRTCSPEQTVAYKYVPLNQLPTVLEV